MKNLFIFILLLMVVSAQSQTSRSFGFKAGINFSNPNYSLEGKDANVNLSGGMGFELGGFVDIINFKNFYVSSGLYFNRKIGKADLSYPGIYEDQIIYTSGDAKVDYLIFGLSVKYKINLGKVIPFVLVEPRMNFLINDKISVTNKEYYDENYVSDQFNKIVFGVNLGLGLELKSAKNFRTIIEVLFCPDFSNAYEDGLGKAQSNSFEIRFGAIFL